MGDNLKIFLLSLAILASPSLWAGPKSCSEKATIKECITGLKPLPHLEALQKIADENGGNRTTGSSGFDRSLEYVESQLKKMRLRVFRSPVTLYNYKLNSAAVSIDGSPQSFVSKTDFHVMDYSVSASLSAPVTAIDTHLGPDNVSTSGCEVEDFVDFPAGHIALIQRGTCSFEDKILNAKNAGASVVIVFNQGNTPDREDAFQINLENGHGMTAMMATYAMGVALSHVPPGTLINIQVNGEITTHQTNNLIAETAEGDPNSIIMVGAHLDSVPEGPGINDNGSGIAALLEVAKLVSKTHPKRKIRMAWWASEEGGLLGSKYFVDHLTAEEKQKIKMYLNFDMIASPNYLLGIYDSDGSLGGEAGGPGSQVAERVFQDFYRSEGRGFKEIPYDFGGGWSDYGYFGRAGIPWGGIYSGSHGLKTAEEVALFGGTENKEYDQCYHSACDRLENLSLEALALNTKAMAYSVVVFAQEWFE
jgi:Zn-dependent M28 family amino/carboxypeptidase